MSNKIILFTLFFSTFFQISNAQKPAYKVNTVAFYNLENLFDTIRNEEIHDESYTPNGDNLWDTKKYQNKLEHMSKVLSLIGTTDQIKTPPAIIGVSEIENRGVLEDLVAMPSLKPYDYQIVHYDSPDERGIDTGLLYRPDVFEVDQSSTHFVELPDTTDRTRDILLVSGRLENEPIHVLVNHWPSRSGGERRSMPNRKAAAELARKIVDSLLEVDPGSRIMLMGDFNDDPVSPSMEKTLNAKIKLSDVRNNDLYNPYYNLYKKGFGTTAWRDSWSLFDMIVLSNSLMDSTNYEGWHFAKANRFNPNWMVQQDGKYKGYPLRTSSFGNYLNGYSDHFPVYVYLYKEIKVSN